MSRSAVYGSPARIVPRITDMTLHYCYCIRMTGFTVMPFSLSAAARLMSSSS